MKRISSNVIPLFLLVCILFLLALPAATYAAESARSTYGSVTAVDFGAAVIPPTNGVYIREDLWYYDGDLQDSVKGGAISADANLKAMGLTTRLFWYPGLKLLGARYGTYLSFAVVDGEADSRITVRIPGKPARITAEQGDRSGFSDLSFTPLSLGWNRGDWHMKWTESVTLPVADYDTTEVLNFGRNYYALNSALALAYRKGTEGIEFNIRSGFIWNAENPDTNYRTGNEAYVDGSLNWRFNPAFTAGLTGYAYQQVTGDSGEGAIFGEFKGENYAVGPAMRLIVDKGRRYSIIAKWLHQFETQHHFEGDMVMISLATKF